MNAPFTPPSMLATDRSAVLRNAHPMYGVFLADGRNVVQCWKNGVERLHKRCASPIDAAREAAKQNAMYGVSHGPSMSWLDRIASTMIRSGQPVVVGVLDA